MGGSGFFELQSPDNDIATLDYHEAKKTVTVSICRTRLQGRDFWVVLPLVYYNCSCFIIGARKKVLERLEVWCSVRGMFET